MQKEDVHYRNGNFPISDGEFQFLIMGYILGALFGIWYLLFFAPPSGGTEILKVCCAPYAHVGQCPRVICLIDGKAECALMEECALLFNTTH